MKSTHHTIFAYAKGFGAACLMAAGTALLMAWAGGTGHSALENYSQQQLDAASGTLPEQLVTQNNRQTQLRTEKLLPLAAKF